MTVMDGVGVLAGLALLVALVSVWAGLGLGALALVVAWLRQRQEAR